MSTPLLCDGVFTGAILHRSHAGNSGCGEVMSGREDLAQHPSTPSSSSHILYVPYSRMFPSPEWTIFQLSLIFKVKV